MSVASPHWSAGTPIPPPPQSASTNIIHNTWLKACCTILCISSWTSSTHRRLGSSSRRICLLTKSSNEISGTNKAGRGPCEREEKLRFEGNSCLSDLIKLRSYFLPLRFLWPSVYLLWKVLPGHPSFEVFGQRCREKCNISSLLHNCFGK